MNKRFYGTGNRVRSFAFIPLAICLMAAAAAKAAQDSGQTSAAAATKPTATKTLARLSHWFQIGKASWYGKEMQGRRTASGEAFDIHKLTCAHRSLPLGTILRVTNLDNQRTVLVRVNDRGPFGPGRILDLSLGAAQSLGFASQGTAHVRIAAVHDEQPAVLDEAELMPVLTEPTTGISE